MSATIDRSAQRFTALQRANEVRCAGADLKRQLLALGDRRMAQREAARLLREEPETIGAMKIHSFLMAVPEMGETSVRRLLTDRREGWYVWPFRRVDELLPRTRERLARGLELRAGRR